MGGDQAQGSGSHGTVEGLSGGDKCKAHFVTRRMYGMCPWGI